MYLLFFICYERLFRRRLKWIYGEQPSPEGFLSYFYFYQSFLFSLLLLLRRPRTITSPLPAFTTAGYNHHLTLITVCRSRCVCHYAMVKGYIYLHMKVKSCIYIICYSRKERPGLAHASNGPQNRLLCFNTLAFFFLFQLAWPLIARFSLTRSDLFDCQRSNNTGWR